MSQSISKSFVEESGMELCKQIFRRAVSAVHPKNLIRNQVSRDGSFLKIKQNHVIDLGKVTGIRVVGFGKAVLPMAEELVQVLDSDQLRSCVLSVPIGTRDSFDPKIELYRGAKNNIPDQPAVDAALKITEALTRAHPCDLVIVLISGGGSALLPLPKPPITLREKSDIVRALSRAGADINELNTVRRKLSMVKGGGLLNFCSSGQIVSLILSDVLGDDIGIIASGPTVLSSDSPSKLRALQVIQKYSLPTSVVSANTHTLLQQSTNQDSVQYELNRSRVENIILGSNSLALNEASAAAGDCSYFPVILTSMLQGEAKVIGGQVAHLCDSIAHALTTGGAEGIDSNITKQLQELQIPVEAQEQLREGIRQLRTSNVGRFKGLCLLFGGETTVRVTGSGVGGRNQELALAAALTLHDLGSRSRSPIVICSGGTDGIDGPCDAAGAIVTTTTVVEGHEDRIHPIGFLDNNDSYNYFKNVQGGKFHLVLGHTETNVMDVVICLIPHSNQPLLSRI